MHLAKHDVKVVGPPADSPEYGAGYYALFFLDPGGLKLEGMVFKPGARRSGALRGPKAARVGAAARRSGETAPALGRADAGLANRSVMLT